MTPVGIISTTNPMQSNPHERALIGRRFQSVEKQDRTWVFVFGAGVSLATESPWRLVQQGRIVVGSEDHGQRFGLPEPVDAAQEVMSRASGRAVEAASIASESGDLMIQFPERICLQLLQVSSGYESWRLSADGRESVCMGGGSIALLPGG